MHLYNQPLPEEGLSHMLQMETDFEHNNYMNRVKQNNTKQIKQYNCDGPCSITNMVTH